MKNLHETEKDIALATEAAAESDPYELPHPALCCAKTALMGISVLKKGRLTESVWDVIRDEEKQIRDITEDRTQPDNEAERVLDLFSSSLHVCEAVISAADGKSREGRELIGTAYSLAAGAADGLYLIIYGITQKMEDRHAAKKINTEALKKYEKYEKKRIKNYQFLTDFVLGR